MLRGLVPVITALGLLAVFCIPAADANELPILTNEIRRASNQSLLWGPYRPNLYFGVRPRIPKSLMTGLLWLQVDNFQDAQQNFRYTCEQHEGMAGYGWDEYDVRTGGQQTIHDAQNFIDITTSFVKIPGGDNGGSWAARIKGVPREDAPPALKTTVIFAAALEGLGELLLEGDPDPYGYEGDVTLQGSSSGLGDYKLVVTKGKGDHPQRMHKSFDDKPLDRTIVHSMRVPDEALWQTKNLVFKGLKEEIEAYISKYGKDNIPPPWQVYTLSNEAGIGNLHLIQKVFEGPFEFDVLFSSASAEKEVTSEELTHRIKTVTNSFKEKFGRIFKLQAPFGEAKYQEFAKSMFSNLFGGIGYFYGDSIVDRSNAPEYDEENEGFWEETAAARARRQEGPEEPSELFTSIPSRPFFPRGFLWDEGFHLLPIADWDMDVTLEIVKSWFNLMDEEGWIGREQILGAEARSKVPLEFQVQYPHYANPPTLFLIFDDLIDRLVLSNGTMSATAADTTLPAPSLETVHLRNPEFAKQYLHDMYPLLRRQYQWFRRTQFGDARSYDREAFSDREVYRWRGRTPQHILPSGLDDYPRPQPPHPGELHVDLMSWMGMMTKSLRRIASYIGADDDAAEYAWSEEAIIRNIEGLHWSATEKTFCDATIDEYEENALVCHKGYVSIFPFLLGLVAPDSQKLGPMLDLLENEEELWSEHGIRSLSKSDEFYGTDENYWRGAVWININYLAARELLQVAQSTSRQATRAGRLYTALRRNVVNTVYESWRETGFAWEQYNPETGAGQRTQHFTGWTSLVVKLMSMPAAAPGAGGQTHDELTNTAAAAAAAAASSPDCLHCSWDDRAATGKLAETRTARADERLALEVRRE